jgi:ligand-binding sensor domain-containing protein/acyl CoA:acetate/3-ketoacid CoA transferase alpha subunit
MWFATDKGLVKFDGKYVTTYTEESGLSENYITCITEDKNKDLWIGTRSKGLIKYDGYNFITYNTDSIAIGREISDFEIDHNNDLWFVMQFGGFNRFDGNKFYSYQTAQGVMTKRPTTSVSVDKENTKWVTGFGKGLYKVDDDGNVFDMERKSGVGSTYINDCIVGDNGGLIFAMWGSRFSYLVNDSVFIYDFIGSDKTDLLTQITEDKDGNYWFCGYGAGIYSWTPGSGEFQFYGTQHGLSSKYVVSIYADDNNGIWVGTDGDGVCRIERNSFSNLNKSGGLKHQYISEIIEGNNGELYYATDEGILKHDSTTITHYFFGNNAPKDVIIDRYGSMWITSVNGGAKRITKDGKGCRFKTQVGTPHNPTALDTTSNGDVWFTGMNADLIQVRGDSIMYKYSINEGLLVQNINDLYITDDDIIWLGSAYQGAAKIQGDSIIYYTSNEGLNSNVINHIGQDNSGRVWICTEKGVNFMEDGKVMSISSENPCFGWNAKSIVQDAEGRYWVPTDQGLIAMVPKIALQEQFNISDFVVYVFDKTNGLNNIVFHDNSIKIDSKNRLLIGSKGGLIIRDLDNIYFDRTAPTAFLSAIDINGETVDFRNLQENGMIAELENSDQIYCDSIARYKNYPEILRLPFNLNHLTFEFSGLNWKDQSHLEFHYYLEGFESEWNKSRSENVADYRNLDYGTYTFHLKSISRDKLESEEFLYSFEIIRPWWHTWWARTSYFLVFGLIVFGLVKWRTAKLRRRQKVLTEEIEIATTEIRKQKDDVENAMIKVEKAHDELNIKNKEIIDSINYAKRIQKAILPTEKMVKTYLENSFIIYKPKDIVAGDFYWMEPNAEGLLLAAADCTGHGVPGAMVSVICNNALNQSVREFGLSQPSKILDKTRQIVVREFDKSEESVNDGMDIALVKITQADDKGNCLLEFSGANNPIWIIRKGATELEEIKGNKQPIEIQNSQLQKTIN